MLHVDPDDPDDRLRWPRRAAVYQLNQLLLLAHCAKSEFGWSEAIVRTLRSAFVGERLARTFEAGRNSPESWRDWLKTLRQEVEAGPEAPPPRPYWSSKQGGGPPLLNLPDAVAAFEVCVRSLDSRLDLWAAVFGSHCPKERTMSDQDAVSLISAKVGRNLPGLTGWPLKCSDPELWTEAEFYDLIEVLHDLASWPASSTDHDFYILHESWPASPMDHDFYCPGHPGEFSRYIGQALYRQEVNRLLARSALGVSLADEGNDVGRIVRSQTPELGELVDEAIASAPPKDTEAVKTAVAHFRAKDRDVDAMRSAVLDLVTVLEDYRKSVLKEELLTGDERALFEIANKFNIRHRDGEQKMDYDPSFLKWIFHWYIATIALVGELATKESQTVCGADGR